MTYLIDLLQQHPLLTFAYLVALGGAAFDYYERRGVDRA